MNVIDTVSRGKESTYMTTFTIDTDNNISAFATAEEAAAAITTTFESFVSQKELAQLAVTWPAERLVAIWNSLPGVTEVNSFKNVKAAASKIWGRIQGLGGAANPEPEGKPKAAKKVKVGAKAAKGASAMGKSGKKATAAKKAPKPKKRRREAKVRVRAARPLRLSRCCSGRTGPRWSRLWRPWAGRSTRSAGSWRAR
jgi:hypothetical protein